MRSHPRTATLEPYGFPGSAGNTFENKDRLATLVDDVESKLFDELASETWVCPGRGAGPKGGAERPSLAEWRARGW